MTFEELDKLVEQAKSAYVPDHLKARQIASSSTVNPYYQLLSELYYRLESPILEIGCYYGCAAACALDGVTSANDNRLPYFGIDICPVPFAHEKFILIPDDSTREVVADQVRKIADLYGGFSLIFQDSSHHYKASVKEWELYSPMLREGGIWLADDVTDAFKRPEDEKSMLGYFNDLPGNKKIYHDLHIGSAMGVIIK